MIKIKELLINNIDYSDYATIPLQTQDALDESLDMAYIELKGLEIESPFVPFSDVDMILEQNGFEVRKCYFVTNDTPTEIISNKKFDHNILLIEQTKWTERFFVEKSVTNPLINDYLKNAKKLEYADITFTKLPSDYPELTTNFLKNNLNLQFLQSPILYKSTINIPNVVFSEPSTADYTFSSGTLTIVDPNNNSVEIKLQRDVITEFTFEEKGDYTFSFDYVMRNGLTLDVSAYTFFVVVNSINQVKIKNPYTIKEAINILLETTETLRKSETPRFRLAEINEYVVRSESYLKKIEEIFNQKSPEFYFSKMSLYEALKTVGNYAHFIPRIEHKKVYLDLLGTNELTKTDLSDYYSHTQTQDINEFCTKLDSQVNNFVNLDDESQGSIITPFNDGLKTLRAETGTAQIIENNIIIPTENPIEKIVKLEIGYLSDGTYVGDITPYVYESAEYDVLSSYSNAYPYSKMYALKYTIGSPNITGLSFERENVISQAFENIAIKNIIRRKLNLPTDAISNLFDNEDTFQLQYRLTYIPSTSTRITQSKAYKDNITKSISIAYNQSASKISSNAYGENLKGQILKMGNAQINKMYVLPSIDLVPRCGDKFDKNYYISVVKCEYYPNFVKCEIGLSKDYNNKSAYVEIDSQLRFYEISEKIAYDTYRIYEDYCEIGFDSQTDGKSLITEDGIDKFGNAFYGGYNGVDVSMVKATGQDKELNNIGNTLALPVLSLGVGNSLLFEYHYKDNFSAGETAYYEDDLQIFRQKMRIQQPIQYTDDYGEVEYLNLKYGKNTTNPIEENGNVIIGTEYQKAVEFGDNLPLADLVPNMEIYFDTKDDPIVLKKDNREAIHFTYQIHFVANNNNLVIGSGISRYSAFTTTEMLNYRLFLLKGELNKFENEIDLTNSEYYGNFNFRKDYINKKIIIEDFVAPEGEWSGWAIAHTINENPEDLTSDIKKAILIVGENKDIKSGDIVEMPNFVFKHKIVEE